MRRVLLALSILGCLSGVARAQDESLEYQVKAAYLFNFLKFVDWPPSAQRGPVIICIVGRNPFGASLDQTLLGETINGRPVSARTTAEAEPGCHVVFVPRGISPAASLRAARMSPVLTVGEAADFIKDGGIVNFVLDNGNVRFEINQQAASRVGLQISSRLLRLARQADAPGPAR